MEDELQLPLQKKYGYEIQIYDSQLWSLLSCFRNLVIEDGRNSGLGKEPGCPREF